MRTLCAGVSMSLFSSVKKRKTRQFISVIVEEERCLIMQKIVKNKEILHKEGFRFDIPSKEDLGPKVIQLLNNLQEEYDDTYIALFLNTLGQGVIPVCDEEKLEKYHVDKNRVKSICVDKRFLMYATKAEINWADKAFSKIGLDFIFSPFLVLDHYIQKEEHISEQVTLYILNTNNALTIMIHKGTQLLYGTFFNVAKEENLLYTDFEDDDNAFEEIDIDEDDLEMDDIGTISDNSNFVNTILKERAQVSEQGERMIKYLNTALKEFYSNSLYESDFITVAKIFDDAGMDEGVIAYIENELLLDTHALNISVRDAILELAEIEVLN